MRSSWSVSVYLCVCEQDKSESENCKRISMKVSELTAYETRRSQRVIWLVFRVLFPGNTESADFVLSAGCLKRVSMSVF